MNIYSIYKFTEMAQRMSDEEFKTIISGLSYEDLEVLSDTAFEAYEDRGFVTDAADMMSKMPIRKHDSISDKLYHFLQLVDAEKETKKPKKL